MRWSLTNIAAVFLWLNSDLLLDQQDREKKGSTDIVHRPCCDGFRHNTIVSQVPNSSFSLIPAPSCSVCLPLCVCQP